jgi:hypothetical protein
MSTEKPNLNSESWAERYSKAAPHLEKKRFHLQADELWMKRLNTAEEALLELQKQYPEIIGLNFYGSATKGYANSESDMDALLFLDGEKMSKEERDTLEKTGTVNLNEQLKQDIYKRLNGDNKPELSFQVRIIDENNINEVLEELFSGIESSQSSGSNVENYVPYFGHKCERLGELFTGISVGNKILEYRRKFLEKLISHGVTGQKLWKEIIGYVRKKEKPILRPGFEDVAVRGGKYEDLYPQTLEQAMKYFVEHKPWRS